MDKVLNQRIAHSNLIRPTGVTMDTTASRSLSPRRNMSCGSFLLPDSDDDLAQSLVSLEPTITNQTTPVNPKANQVSRNDVVSDEAAIDRQDRSRHAYRYPRVVHAYGGGGLQDGMHFATVTDARRILSFDGSWESSTTSKKFGFWDIRSGTGCPGTEMPEAVSEMDWP
ncbi:uncharacterized protein CCOS01_17086 [Colletotrichum costaricense]|uniref:Uncharacterized protein n=1 Tax=Colletotrichum costaricense TaxID=1209916 RepID=A0AAI9YED1_9PEZI|nr:uncharacterized protein CCOS01_17086 [Colletotrichum costaricense]KAK1503133.1 hypothetical protein CCOS01_17086 [Colletotrichum costaricense]